MEYNVRIVKAFRIFIAKTMVNEYWKCVYFG